MSCNCVHEIEKRFVEDQPLKDRNQVITKATMRKVITLGPGALKAKPVIPITLNIEGRKKPVIMDLAYSFCPFCGNTWSEVKEATT